MNSGVITAVGGVLFGVLAWIGGKGWLDRWMAKRDAQQTESKELATAQGNLGLDAIKLSIAETRATVAGLKTDVATLKGEKDALERKVDDLRRVVEEYRSGLRVPAGQVLIPLIEIRSIREHYAGALKRGAYPGEFEDTAEGYLDVRMRPLPPSGS